MLQPFNILRLSQSLGSALVLLYSVSLQAAEKPAFNYDAYTHSVEQTQLQQIQEFIGLSTRLNQTTQKACTSSGQQNHAPLQDWPSLPTLQEQWRNTYQQWQRLQVFPLGPNNDVTTRLNISFWPDKKNLVERKARALLKQGDQAELKNGGIALQGLTASEYLLFDPKHLKHSTPADSCHLLMAITYKSQENATAMLTRWQQSEFLSHWHDAALGNDSFASTKQATGYLMDGLAQTLEQMAKYKLYKPFRLNDADAQPNPYLAENWRSDQGLVSLKTNLDQIEDYYFGLTVQGQTQPVNGPDLLLRHLGFADEADAIKDAFKQTQSQLDTLMAMGSEAYQTMAGKTEATALNLQIKTLERALKKPLPHFQLAQRFNSADGD
ncbi:imelysin family protein [Oceanospirillum linum]|uniref:Imelysin-like domain-containing protein n=1 Tax=Oceanospirillum linum TaxID=966 RepID=A0A1T1HEF7_OCELI|nr:imelysin family protein [Oceanospirillum linum]OOV88234.1 hypothetical protein BTA35_0201515 [Oceanospirillum linum]SEF49208.1 Predicted lipoprotein [Oleiphilus messinensis]SMP03310.1 hypothetical protein SAMN06264348_101314 [Oceanospirillum linum]